MRGTALILFIVCAFTPFVTYGAQIKGVERYVVAEDEVVHGNAYVAASAIDVRGKMEGDFVASGQSIFTSGIVEGDTLLLGVNAYATGTMQGDVRILGGNVKIGGTIKGDLVVVGGTVDILPEASILGDIIVLGGQITLRGNFAHHLKVIGGEVVLHGTISDTADVTAHTFIVANDAHITGLVSYFSHKPATIEGGGDLAERIAFNQIEWLGNTASIKDIASSFFNFWVLLSFVTTSLLAFVLLFVFKVFSQSVTLLGKDHFIKNFFIGLATLIGVPLLSCVFIISLFALPIGVILLCITLIIYFIASAYAGMMTGLLVAQKIFKKKDTEVNFVIALLGIACNTALHFVPYVGSALGIIIFMSAFGSVYRNLYFHLRYIQK